MKILKFIKRFFGIAFLVFSGFCVVFIFTEDLKIPFIVEAVIFCLIGFLLLRKPKESGQVHNVTEPTDTYTEDDNVIVHTDGSVITKDEIPYLVSLGLESTRTNMTISTNIRIIQESYTLMRTTTNPETLCSRYKLCLSKLEELQYYANQGVNVPNLDVLIQSLSNENYCSLIRQCYQSYMDKAKMELKTEAWINKRKQKFLDYIRQNVDVNILMKLSIF